MEASAETQERLEAALKVYQELSGPFQEAKTALWRTFYDVRCEVYELPDCEYVLVDMTVHAKGAECYEIPSFEEFLDGVDWQPLERMQAKAVAKFAVGTVVCDCVPTDSLAWLLP